MALLPAKGNQQLREPWGGGPAVKLHLETHLHSTEPVQHAFLRVRNPTSPIVGGAGELHIPQLKRFRSCKLQRCFFMQLHAVTSVWGLCDTTMSFRPRKNEDLVLTALPSPRPPDGDTHHCTQEPPLSCSKMHTCAAEQWVTWATTLRNSWGKSECKEIFSF